MRKKMVSLVILVLFFLFSLASSAYCIDAPSDLNAKYKGKFIELKWRAAEGATGYHINRSTGGGSFEAIGYVSGNNGRFIDSDIEKNKKYRYQVNARGIDNNKSAASNTAEATAKATVVSDDSEGKTTKTTKKYAAIDAPENLTAEYSKKEEGIKLTWEGEYNLSKHGFNVYRSVGDSFDSDKFKKIASLKKITGLKFVDTDVEKGKNYNYYVEAVSGSNKSEKSMLVTAKAGAPSASAPKYSTGGPVHICFASNMNFLAIGSVNPEDGTVYIAFYDHATNNWFSWTAVGSVSTPFPNYDEGNTAVDISFCEPSDGRVTVCLYSYNTKEGSMYSTVTTIDIKTRNAIAPWQAWKNVDGIAKPADKFTESARISFCWDQTTHWFVSWAPEDGTAYVKPINGGTGFMNAGLEVPSNYGENSFCASGMYKDKKGNLITGLMCFNMDDSTATYSENSGPGNSWRSFATISNKSIGVPPNATGISKKYKNYFKGKRKTQAEEEE
ncbi:MAG: hypothetical protein A2008_07405 [Candidatus Wallbacteria bacterium GWC2_49_35]|uniref:Fibronectin type-III domain-containing protein n=1 Tax=Candidatus Wallbacteria bacterium GWC2_49_35 TaxID=1817813 RepID=A0A1F7WEC4_9BACT|nr:MAG: hypothetical protein A2008_07405 [Candidatus Wallbacteria bacterium GWC2_49_35]